MATTTVIRIDPVKKTIAKLKFKAGRSIRRELARSLRIPLRDLVHHHLLNVPTATTNGVEREIPMIVVAARGQEEDVPGWRLRGAEDTAGIGILCGGTGDMLVPVPVDEAWVRKRLVWIDPKSLDDVATGMWPSVPEDVRGALSRSREMADLYFLNADDVEAMREPMMALGFTETHGHLPILTQLGVAARKLALGENN